MPSRSEDLQSLSLARKLKDVHETFQKAVKRVEKRYSMFGFVITIMYRVVQSVPVFHAVTRWVRGYNRRTPTFQYLLPKLDLLTYKTFPLLVRLCFRKALVSAIHALRKTA